MPSLRVEGRVSTAQVDKVLVDASAYRLSAGTVLLDLAAATAFDVAALQQLLSTIAARRNEGVETMIRLPADAAARHILRLWRFPHAVGSVARVPFRVLVTPEDRAYFGEKTLPAPLVSDAGSPRSSVLAYLTAQQRFGLRPYRLDDELARLHMLEGETSCWGGFALTRLLQSVLAGPASELIRVLVQELVSGPLQRSSGRVAITGAQLELPDEKSGTGTLTLAVWDDSESLITHLRKREPVAEVLRADEFALSANGWSPGEELGRAHWRHWPDSEDPEVLLAGLIGSAPRDRYAKGHAEGSHGLYALYNCAVDAFGGSLRIESRQTRLEVSAVPGSGTVRYRVDVATGSQLPYQHGNLLTVRLPVRDD
ncbi:hypothetical protein [Streptomyces sp. NPDC087859]|uniref:hypothetical protein n=1 Tax=Streptomyces sp. NPDC087859 TaxID=3365812 RepID=UPI0037FA32B5